MLFQKRLGSKNTVAAAAAPSCEMRPKNTPLRIVRFLGEAQCRYRWFQRDSPAAFGEWVRAEMTMLGPAFVKLGQALSTRTDLLDAAIVTELAKLQDNNDPADFADIRSIVETSLGRPIEEVFSSFDPVPIASASIGQVHRARLLSGAGGGAGAGATEVVVKVQKPCVARQIRDDLATIKGLNAFFIGLGFARAAESESIVTQYEQFLSVELDYRKEQAHMLRFREFLEDSPVIVPEVYTELSSETVLVMEYVPSIKITDTDELRARGYDTTRVADNLVNVFLQMIVTHGYVHCDPHPGNLGVSPDDEETLVLYDYGNVIELSPEFRAQLNNMIFAIYQKDVDEFVELIIRLGILQVTDPSELVDIKVFFGSFFKYLESLDFTTLKDSIQAQAADSAGSGGGGPRGARGGPPIRINPDFLSLFRVFSLMDGTCAKLDPSFSYIRALSPFVENIMMDVNFFDYRARKDLAKLQNYPRLLQNTDQNLTRLDRRVKDLSVNQGSVQNVVIAFIVFEHISEPVTLLPWIPVIAYYIYSTRR